MDGDRIKRADAVGIDLDNVEFNKLQLKIAVKHLRAISSSRLIGIQMLNRLCHRVYRFISPESITCQKNLVLF
jgi:hypothetical protein